MFLIERELLLEKSELLYSFGSFDPADWTLIKHTPKWSVQGDAITGGASDEPHHGQIFFCKPVVGDVVLEFDAKILPPSYHDIVWFWNTRFDQEPWSAGFLGCLGGWWGDFAGIEKLPDYVPSAIHAAEKMVPGRKYHIVSGSVGHIHFIAVDGKLVTRYADRDLPDPTKPGYFGFGIYESHCSYSNLRVWRPYSEPAPRKYKPITAS